MEWGSAGQQAARQKQNADLTQRLLHAINLQSMGLLLKGLPARSYAPRATRRGAARPDELNGKRPTRVYDLGSTRVAGGSLKASSNL